MGDRRWEIGDRRQEIGDNRIGDREIGIRPLKRYYIAVID